MIELTFHGAAREVTGSCHIVRFNGFTVMLDCGLFQGRRTESQEKNRSFGFDPKEIDVLVLSHAHIDHSGRIPQLCKEGFEGPIYCTPATRDLANIMLLDSAHVQQKDTEFINKKHKQKGLPPIEPLYDTEDVLTAIDRFLTVGYRRTISIGPNVKLTYYDAGHILGSAQVSLEFSSNGSTKRLLFTGDVGRPDRPIIRDPEFPGHHEIVITESTYGGTLHEEKTTALDRLATILHRAMKRGCKVIVPAFSVGRTQELVYDMHQLREQRRLPEMPVYVDSPLSVNATQVFRLHPECMDPEIREEILLHQDPFGFERLTYVASREDSMALNGKKGPMVIISASGMCEAGRIVHHLSNNIENPETIVMMTGYCAENTLGRKIINREQEINIFGEPHRLNAEVEVFTSLSAHADQKELLDHLGKLDAKQVEQTFIVHGEFDEQQAFKSILQDKLGYTDIKMPERGDSFVA